MDYNYVFKVMRANGELVLRHLVEDGITLDLVVTNAIKFWEEDIKNGQVYLSIGVKVDD